MQRRRRIGLTLTALAAAALAACAQVPPPERIGQIGQIDKNWVQMVDVDTHPRGGTCAGEGLRPVPTEAAGTGRNLFYISLEPEPVTVTCAFADGSGASRTVERALHQKAWSSYKSGAVLGALIGGGILAAAVVGADKPDENFHFYPFVLNVAHPDHLSDPAVASGAVSEFEARWNAVISDFVQACIDKGGSEKRCSDERDMEFFDTLRVREIEYLNSFSGELPPGGSDTEPEAESVSAEPSS